MTRSHEATFDVALPRERVWEVMADTQHLNQLYFGMDPGKVISRDGEKARVTGSFGIFAPEYDEYPWSFDVPKHYRSVRVFTKGALDRLETECSLEAVDAAHTRVRYTLRVTAKGVIGALAARIVIRRLRQGLVQARAFLEKMARGSTHMQVAAVQWPPANPQREAVLARARGLADEIALPLDSAGKALLEQLVLHIADGTDADVARLRPYALADAWVVPRKLALEVCLRAAKGGLLRLSWDVLCPACEGATTVASLKDLPTGGHCPACDIDFSTSFEENVEGVFSPEPQVRQAERFIFCHGSPSSTQAWLAQFVVEPKSSHTLQLRLGTGRYRFQAQSVSNPCLIDVVQEGGHTSTTVKLEGNVDGLRWSERLGKDGAADVPPLAAGDVTIVVHNSDEKRHRVQLAHRAFASQAATAADLVGLKLFRDLFGREIFSPEQHVGVGQMAILFTDLVGSTALYERIGDVGAYALVRDHFKLLFRAIEARNGRVVKTVGDCVMAAFNLPADATWAGFDCIMALRTLRDGAGNNPGVRLKVGVHTGSCLAVEANKTVDYFGRTVNIAARVESLAAPDELVLSWAVLAAHGVKSVVDELSALGHTASTDHQKVKGIEGDVEVVRVAVKQ